MKTTLTKINELLQNNGYEERFVLEIDSENSEFLTLYHKSDKQKKIDFVIFDNENGGETLFYLDSHYHFDYFENEIDIEYLFYKVRNILDNKIVSFYKTDKENQPISCGDTLLDLDVNSIEYGAQERDYLDNPNIIFQSWLGNLTENEKLFVIGAEYTEMPEIAVKRYEKEFLSGPYHEFGIIEKIDQSKDYEKYEPDKYNVIKFPDNLIDEWFPEIRNLSVYFHKLSRPEKGLTRHGITLIPPESLDMLYNIVDKKTRHVFCSTRLNIFETKTKLLEMILKANDEKKFIIHFGV
ncbi:MAG: hypothetical protein FWE03_06445 [Firmicutes bacterium]|nr:hypothetical protein [Bacillota bacterium]